VLGEPDGRSVGSAAAVEMAVFCELAGSMKNFNGAGRSSTTTSFSVAKSFVSALIGVAIADGKIGLGDPIIRLPARACVAPGLGKIRVRHLIATGSSLHSGGTPGGSN
jgi:CubicO group peptidase (beta-lactamase class C family)